MATELGRVKSTAASKYDAIVASQLKRAESRIRMLDLTSGLLGFAVLSLAYMVGMALCDSKLLLSQHARQLSLYVYLTGAAFYLFCTVLRPLRLYVNPYYAARQVEQQLPQAKNSIVNWVDLHDQPLPPAIRSALGQRAAKDLSRIDFEQAISSRRTAWMGGLAGLFAIIFLASYFLLGPAPFVSLLKRTFNPFEEVGVSTRTRLTLLKPEHGNATVTVGRGVKFVVDVSGKVPDPKAADAVKLLYRYEESDPWLERRLLQEPSGEWTASLSALEVKNGFWYQITGGDAVTEEYRISVRAAPAILDFLATYHFRPYAARPDEVRLERELKALRGTEVLLRVRTNRSLREGRLEFVGNRREGVVNPPVISVRGEVDAEEQHSFLVQFVFDEDGKYRLCFTSTDGEAFGDPASYPVTAIPDQPPTVELTKPGQDIRLPADALLHLEGKAADDVGIQSLILRTRVIGGDRLRGQPYRSDEQLRLADGGFPSELEYKDFVDLSRVKGEDGQDVRLRSGMELEYWLEASDACDYPRPNVTESKHYRVVLTDPEKIDPKKNQQKQQAEKEKKLHEQKQDQKLQKENQERQQQRQQQESRNKEAADKNKAEKGAAGEKSRPKEGEQANNSEGKESNGQQGESKDGQGESKNGEQKSGLSNEDQKIEDQIKKALERKEAAENGKGGSKSDKPDSGEEKRGQPNKPTGSDGPGGKPESENAESGQQNTKQTGEGKDQPQAGSDPSRADGKSDKSEPKGDGSKNRTGNGSEGKNQAGSKPQPGESKSDGDSQPRKNAEQGKEKSISKEQGSVKEDSNSTGAKKQQSKSTGDRKDDGKTEKKQDGSGSKADPSRQGEASPSAGKTEGEKKDNEKGGSKPKTSDSARKATAKDIADLNRALENEDASEREKAKQQLQRIAEQAADPDARQKAGEALKKLGNSDTNAGNETPKQGNDPSSGPDGKDKDRTKIDGPKGNGSSGEKENARGAGSGPEREQGEKNTKDRSSTDTSDGSQKSPGGDMPAGGNRRSGSGLGDTHDAASPIKAEKPRDHSASLMQLEDFAKQVNKDILKDAGVSDAAWKKYLEAKRKLLSPREKQRPEAPNAPQQAKQLPSMGGRTIQPSASGSTDAHGPDRGQPPPGYRDSFRKFTRQMSK
jgi:hypothetical protein